MKLKRILYLAYYLREINWEKFSRFSAHALRDSKRSRLGLWFDVVLCTFKYNVSILDYFHFQFYRLSGKERASYAGTGFMYEYQLKMNPRAHREVLENKIMFLNTFSPFVNRKFATRNQLKGNPALIEAFLASGSGKLVAKGSRGQIGAEVKVIQSNAMDARSLLRFMEAHNLDLVEEYVTQHNDLMKLSPSGLNTVRIFTQLQNDKVIYLGARLRITINSDVDNMAAGNIATPIDLSTGQVTGPGVFSDITKNNLNVHPVTGANIIGFQIPFWQETLEMVERASLYAPENRSVGWDIAITEMGPELIEGNHNWCKLLWQMPVNRGLKDELLQFV